MKISCSLMIAFVLFPLLVEGKKTKNALWSDPVVSTSSVLGSSSVTYSLEVNISPRVDSVTVEYGFDARPLLEESSSSSGRRRLSLDGSTKDSMERQEAYTLSVSKRQRRAHVDTTTTTTTTATTRRGLQEEDPFFVFGGTIRGIVHNSTFSAQWDLTFPVLVEAVTNKKSELYVQDKGGSEGDTFPCIYFPTGTTVTTEQVKAMISEKDAIAAGGQVGHVKFSSHSFHILVNDRVVLPEAGGQFVPKQDASGSLLSGSDVSAIFGGLNGTVFDWTETSKFTVDSVSAHEYLFKRGVKTVTLDMYAQNDKLDDFAYALFDISPDGSIKLGSEGLEDGKQRMKVSSDAGTFGFGATFFLVMMITSLLSW